MRKNGIRTLLAALLIASVLPVSAFAETGIVTGSQVNVRSGPGSEYSVLGSCTRGRPIEVIGRSGSWYTVNYEGRVGYMSADYLSLETGGGIIVTATPALPSSSEAGQNVLHMGGQSASLQPNAQITGAYVRFRSGPSSSSAVLGEYSQGKAVTVLGTQGDWTLCAIDGVYGYIFSRYVGGSTGSAASVTVTPAPVVSTPGILIQQGSPAAQTSAAANTDSGILLVTSTPAPAADSDPGTPGTIVGDNVRFRRGPGSEYSIIRTFDNGKAITILSIEGDWVCCTVDGCKGYVASQFVYFTSTGAPVSGSSGAAQSAAVTPASPAPTAAPVMTPPPTPAPVPDTSLPANAVGSTGYIKGNNVRLRSGPELSSTVIGELFYGNVVTVTGVSGAWISIRCGDREGYVSSEYVAIGTPQTASVGGSATGREVADYALQFLGTPYHWGGTDPDTGFDCSGLTYYVFQHFGYSLNRLADQQALNGKHVDAADMQPGDLICFYSGGSYIGHVGICIGNNMFVHAATSTTGVITSELTGYYAQRGFEVRRIIN